MGNKAVKTPLGMVSSYFFPFASEPVGTHPIYGEKVDKKKISLESEIKGFGTFTAEIKLHPGISAKVYVVVSEE